MKLQRKNAVKYENLGAHGKKGRSTGSVSCFMAKGGSPPSKFRVSAGIKATLHNEMPTKED